MQFCLRSAQRPNDCRKSHGKKDRTIDVKQPETGALLNRLKYNFINIELTCATNENSDQPLHPRSLIRGFDGRPMDSQRPKFPQAEN